MNKATYFKLIDQLKANILKDLDKHPNIKLYVNSWVIGGLSQMEAKARGEMVYPYDATYKELFFSFYEAYLCINISEHIKDETFKYLNNDDNLKIINKIRTLIKA